MTTNLREELTKLLMESYDSGVADTIEAATAAARAAIEAEREACAKVCEAEYEGYDWADRERDGAEACAAAIRARSRNDLPPQ